MYAVLCRSSSPARSIVRSPVCPDVRSLKLINFDCTNLCHVVDILIRACSISAEVIVVLVTWFTIYRRGAFRQRGVTLSSVVLLDGQPVLCPCIHPLTHMIWYRNHLLSVSVLPCLSYRVSDVSQSDAIPQHPRHVLLPPNCESVLMELCFYSASNAVATRWDPTQPFNSPVSSHSSSNRKFKYGT